MKKSFLILPVLLINLGLMGCAHKSDKIGVLEARADYNNQKTLPKAPKHITRTDGKIKKAWLHAHEMPTGDYFGGAWVYLLIERTQWNFSEK